MKIWKSKLGWAAVGIFAVWSGIAFILAALCHGWFCGLEKGYYFQFWPVAMFDHGLFAGNLIAPLSPWWLPFCLIAYYLIGLLGEILFRSIARRACSSLGQKR